MATIEKHQPETAFEFPKGTGKLMREAAPNILWTLRLYGPVEDRESGRASHLLATLMHTAKTPWKPTLGASSQLSNYLAELETARWGKLIVRERRSTRTYAIRLNAPDDALPPLPEGFPVGHPLFEEELPAFMLGLEDDGTDDESDDDDVESDESEESEESIDSLDEPTPTLAPAAMTPELLSDDDDLSPLDLLLFAQQLTTQAILGFAEMATRVEARIDEASEQSVDNEMAERLAMTLEENTRLRNKLRDVSAVAEAKSREAEAVRRALRQSESNLNALRTGSQVNDSGFKALRRMMTERPRTPNGQ